MYPSRISDLFASKQQILIHSGHRPEQMCIRDSCGNGTSRHTPAQYHNEKQISEDIQESTGHQKIQRRLAAVSYTHLDVYKRQLHALRLIPALALHGCADT